MTLSLESLEAKIKARDAVAAKQNKNRLLERIAMLFETGRIDKPIHDRLKTEAEAVQLSIGDDGEVSLTRVHHEVGAFEQLKPGAMWTPVDLSVGGYRPAPMPGKTMTDQEALAAWDAAEE